MYFYGQDVTDYTRDEINKLFKDNDDSHLWPVEDAFNATDAAIQVLRDKELEGAVIPIGGFEYALALDSEISRIVNEIV